LQIRSWIAALCAAAGLAGCSGTSDDATTPCAPDGSCPAPAICTSDKKCWTPPADYLFPPAITGIGQDGSRVMLSWAPVPGAATYAVYQQSSPASESRSLSLLGTTAGTSSTFGPLPEDQALHWFAVASRAANGHESPPSSPASILLPGAPVTQLTAFAQERSISFTGMIAGGAGHTATFALERAVDGGPFLTRSSMTQAVPASGAVSATDALEDGLAQASLRYRLHRTDAEGDATPSNEVSLHVPAVPDAVLSVVDGAVRVSWTAQAPAAGGALSYFVSLNRTPLADPQPWFDVGTLRLWGPGQAIPIQVRAVETSTHGSLDSPWSPQLLLLTPPDLSTGAVHPTNNGLLLECFLPPGRSDFYRSLDGGPYAPVGDLSCGREDTSVPLGSSASYAARFVVGEQASVLSDPISGRYTGPADLEVLADGAAPSNFVEYSFPNQGSPQLGQRFKIPKGGRIDRVQLALWADNAASCVLTGDDGTLLAHSSAVTQPKYPCDSCTLGLGQDSGTICKFDGAWVSAGASVRVLLSGASALEGTYAKDDYPGGELLDGRGEDPVHDLEFRVFIADAPPQAAPALAATPGYYGVHLAWSPNPQATSYAILSGPDCAGLAVQTSTVELSFDLSGLERAQAGCYAVEAQTAAGPLRSVPAQATSLDRDLAWSFDGLPGALTLQTSTLEQPFTARRSGTLDRIELLGGSLFYQFQPGVVVTAPDGSSATLANTPAYSYSACCLLGELQPLLPGPVVASFGAPAFPIVAGTQYTVQLSGVLQVPIGASPTGAPTLPVPLHVVLR
jgi:hypothetical protein